MTRGFLTRNLRPTPPILVLAAGLALTALSAYSAYQNIQIPPAILLVFGFLLSFVACHSLDSRNTRERETRRSERQLRLVINALPALISYLDSDQKFRFCSKSYESWFSVKHHDIIGRPVRDIIGQRNYQGIRLHIEKALSGRNVQFEHDLILPNGSVTPVFINCVPDLDGDGRVRGCVAFFSDISDKRRAEIQNKFLVEKSAVLSSSLNLDTTLERFAKIITPSLADWCLIDFIDESDGPRKRVGSASDTRRLRLVNQMIRLAPLPNRSDAVTNVIRTGQPVLISAVQESDRRELSSSREHAELLKEIGCESIMITPLKARNRVIGSVTFARARSDHGFTEDDFKFAIEVTRRAALTLDNVRLYQDVWRANRSKDEFLTTLSHELRTPMNVILGWLEVLSHEDIDEDTFEQALTTLNRNARMQMHLINDLLDISRIVNGKLHLALKPTDLSNIVSSALDGIRPAVKAKHLNVVTHMEAGDAAVLGDPDRIHQILWNLLSNSIKFTPENGTVHLRLKDATSSVMIEVEDTGIGIDPEFISYIFDRFRQEDGSNTRSQGGLGLGLSITRYLVELHGGSIEAASAGRGKGAKFTVRLPRGSVASSASLSKPKTVPSSHQ